MKSVANGGQQAVAERHQGRGEQFVLGDEPCRLAHRGHLCVAGRRIAGPATGRRAVHDDHAARAQQPYTFDHVVRLVERVGVDEHQVIGVVGQPGQHFLGSAADQPGPRRADARVGEGLLGDPLVFRLDVDGGQHAVVAHPGQQPQAADAGAGADLDDGLSAAEFGQQAQQRSDRRRYRAGADVGGTLAGGQQHRILGDRTLGMRREGVGPTRRRWLAWRAIGRGHGVSVSPTPAACSQARPSPATRHAQRIGVIET